MQTPPATPPPLAGADSQPQQHEGADPALPDGMMTRNLHVSEVAKEVTVEEFCNVFEQFGTVLSHKLMVDIKTGRPRGFGFVLYEDVESARRALRGLSGYELRGKRLVITPSQEKCRTPQGKPSNRLFIRQLPPTATEDMVTELLAPLRSKTISLFADGGALAKLAQVTMETAHDAQLAARRLNNDTRFLASAATSVTIGPRAPPPPPGYAYRPLQVKALATGEEFPTARAPPRAAEEPCKVRQARSNLSTPRETPRMDPRVFGTSAFQQVQLPVSVASAPHYAVAGNHHDQPACGVQPQTIVVPHREPWGTPFTPAQHYQHFVHHHFQHQHQSLYHHHQARFDPVCHIARIAPVLPHVTPAQHDHMIAQQHQQQLQVQHHTQHQQLHYQHLYQSAGVAASVATTAIGLASTTPSPPRRHEAGNFHSVLLQGNATMPPRQVATQMYTGSTTHQHDPSQESSSSAPQSQQDLRYHHALI